MKRNKLKNLAVVLACTMMLGTMPTASNVTALPAVTQTVEAAAKSVTLKVSNKKVYAGRSGKIKAKNRPEGRSSAIRLPIRRSPR